MSLLKASKQIHVVLVTDRADQREKMAAALEGGGSSPVVVVDETSGPVDVVIAEVGGESELGLFHGALERFPSQPVIVVCAARDAALAEVAQEHGAGDTVFFEDIGGPVLGRVVRFAVERHRLARQLVAAREREAQLATHDCVTGLANRSLLFTCIEPAMSFAERRETGVGVVCLGLRGLADLNARFGYKAGDRILAALAERLQDAIRTSDMVARLGGGEFLILFRDIDSAQDAARALQGILEELERPIYVAGHKVSARTVAGISHFPVHGRDAETLVAAAHAAMTEAKSLGVAMATASEPEAREPAASEVV